MNSPAIDRSTLAALHAVDSGFVADLAASFLNSAPLIIAELRTATVLDKRDNIRRLAQDLRESSAVFGAAQLSNLCGAAEYSLSLPSWLSEVEAAYQRLTTELQALA
jgi:HPt (histidine-containing phosphotransfer) domain-containing protein